MNRNIRICCDLEKSRKCSEFEECDAGVLCSYDRSAVPNSESNFNLLDIPVGCQKRKDQENWNKKERIKEKIKNL
jgi:hypothetical protein